MTRGHRGLRTRLPHGVGAIAFIVLAACDSPAGPPSQQNPTVTSIRVELPVATAVEGQTIQATATVLDQNGQAMHGESVMWSTSDPQIASVATDGSVEAHTAGTVAVRATNGGVVGEAALAVTVDGWELVAAGSDHTCGVRMDGRVFCWGKNGFGQLGDGTTNASSTPVMVTLPMGLDVVGLEAAGDQTCVLGSDGSAYCWGYNRVGQLGNGTTDDSPVPLRVSSGATLQTLTIGPMHACALDAAGLAYCWGGGISQPGGNMALGFDPPDDCGEPGYLARECSMVPRALPTTLRFASINAGLFLTCANTSAGEAYCWGWNQYAQLGSGPATLVTDGTTVPEPVAGGISFASVNAGSLQGCGLDSGGAAYCWGALWNFTPSEVHLGQLGTGGPPNSDGSDSPVPVTGGLGFESVVTNSENNIRALITCGIATSQDVYCWGANERDQLGAPAPDTCEAIGRNVIVPCTSVPQPVQGNLRALEVAIGKFHTCALGVDRELYCWGSNDDGQLGDTSTTSTSVPVKVTRQ